MTGEQFTAVLGAIIVTIAGSAVLVRLAGTAPESVVSSPAGL